MTAPEYDPLQYLALLEDYTSRETTRLRRNLTLLSFSLIVIEVFDTPIDQLRIGSVPITQNHEFGAAIIGIVLLSYWLVLFIIRFLADYHRHGERVHIALAKRDEIQRDCESIDEKRNTDPNSVSHSEKRRYGEQKPFLKAFDRQHDRTKRGRILLVIAQGSEWLPTMAIAGWALYVWGLRTWTLWTSVAT